MSRGRNCWRGQPTAAVLSTLCSQPVAAIHARHMKSLGTGRGGRAFKLNSGAHGVALGSRGWEEGIRRDAKYPSLGKNRWFS